MRSQVYYQRFFGTIYWRNMQSQLLPFTHRPVKEVEAETFGDVFRMMQGEVWSPDGEARPLIESLHLSHTSMSIGDIVKHSSGDCWLCVERGWSHIGSYYRLSDDLLYMGVEHDRIKVVSDVDCLDPQTVSVESFDRIPFQLLLSLAPCIETEYKFCIDLGNEFYESGSK